MYIRLFHGRSDPKKIMENWGIDGPVIGPVGVAWTYGDLKIFRVTKSQSWDAMEFLPVEDGLVYFDKMWYGDMEFWDNSDPLIKENKGAIIDYDTFVKKLAQVP